MISLYFYLISLFVFINTKVCKSADAAAWFSYVRKISDIHVLVYNRIPKCGSSTIIHILTQAALKLRTYTIWSTNESYWEKDYNFDDENAIQYNNHNSNSSIVSLPSNTYSDLHVSKEVILKAKCVLAYMITIRIVLKD